MKRLFYAIKFFPRPGKYVKQANFPLDEGRTLSRKIIKTIQDSPKRFYTIRSL